MEREGEANNEDCIGKALQILYGLEQAEGYPHGFAVIDPADLTDLVYLLKKAGDRP